LIVDTPTAGETISAELTLESDDFDIVPYTVLAGVVGSSLGKAGVALGSKLQTYPVNASVRGGGELKVYGTALAPNTVAPMMGCEIIISDQPPQAPRVKAKIGTLTNVQNVGTETAGTPYTITGCTKLIEVYGSIWKTIVGATEGVGGFIRFSSPEMTPPFPVKVIVEPLHGALSTDATTASNLAPVVDIARRKVDLNIKPAQTTFSDYCYLEGSANLGTAGRFISGVLCI